MKWDVSNIQKWSWKDHPLGLAGLEAGNGVQRETGAWRSFRPILDRTKCNNCLICFIYCPDGAIGMENGTRTETDLYHCKGCGICAYECSRKAITMIDEHSQE